ncbi:MAG: S8 family serine peptidase [Planctomycetota bacterium]|nr:S8 family serine peptidase [Planctomycetota bacterium]
MPLVSLINNQPARLHFIAALGLLLTLLSPFSRCLAQPGTQRLPPIEKGLLASERLQGKGAWVDEAFKVRFRQNRRARATIWFDDQLLGDGEAYTRRSREFSGRKRGELGRAAARTLKAIHERSWNKAAPRIRELIEKGMISQLERHWIVNGFSCITVKEHLESLRSVPGVKKIFAGPRLPPKRTPPQGQAPVFKPQKEKNHDPRLNKHPWYIRSLLADRAWKQFGVRGKGILNVVHDFNFVFSDNLTGNLYRNPGELPGNGIDDDRNGLVDDYHGFNFDAETARLTSVQVPLRSSSPQGMHGFMCAAIICGRGVSGKEYEFGIAPEANWAGVIAGGRLEKAVQWAIEQGADTYSMSFSIPRLREYRSHWRKLMEHGSLCGLFFVSGAGNFAQTEKTPVQMRTPEDIPEVVFAAAGVQRDFNRTPFSSQGPVNWQTEHYRDGVVQKPEVCAFNMGLPLLRRDGSTRPVALNGNSFAGPMFCGAIALMLSADPDLLPWDLKEIITKTATDVGAKGIDAQTGHGLINCYRAVKEVLRRKALREGRDPKTYTGRESGDEVDLPAAKEKLTARNVVIARIAPGGQAAKAGIETDDLVRSYDGRPITTISALRSAVRASSQRPGRKITLVITRGGKKLEFIVKPGPLGIQSAAHYAAPVFK